VRVSEAQAARGGEEDGARLDLDACLSFYRKHLDAGGLPIVAAQEVSDVALQRAWWIVTHMLAGRPDILRAMIDNGTRLAVIGKDQVYTDLPEYREIEHPEYWNERVRGTGGFDVTSFGEENLLSWPVDRYDDESIAVHEFCHTIDAALLRIDPTWEARLEERFHGARDKGLFENTYAATDAGEYWAEMGQAYFDCNRVNNWNHGPVGHREQLEVYDPEGYGLVRATFNLRPEQDWRYAWLRPLPRVSAPPARLDIDPYYTKFTYARELIVVGRNASDDALLKANDTIRRMFAYRHDVLKALIDRGLRLVVLAPDEGVSDLPEYRRLADGASVDALTRYPGYSPEMNLIVVDQENQLADPGDDNVGDNHVIRAFAKAVHAICGRRPPDPAFAQRPPRLWQQYELRVKRMDVSFDKTLRALFNHRMTERKWRGTSAANSPGDYWAAGVLAYFDAAGQDATPEDARSPIRTRELLERYDPELFALVDETLAYRGRVEWRYEPFHR